MADLEFEPSLFGDMLGVRGEKAEFRLFHRRVCYCTDPATLHHDPHHAACNGTGFLEEEIDVSQKSIWVQDIKPTSAYVKYGLLKLGDILASHMPGDFEITENDYVVLTNPGREIQHEQALSHGAVGGVDQLRFPYITRLDRVYDATGTYASTVYQIGSDARSIDWSPAGSEPAVSGLYGVEYWFSPTYKLLSREATHRRSVGGVKLPRGTPLCWRERDTFRDGG